MKRNELAVQCRPARWVRYLSVLIVVSSLASAVTCLAQCQRDPKSGLGVVDGPVSAIELGADAVYLGGDFSYAGPRNGSVAAFDVGTWARVEGFPFIEGTVYAVEPDGAGGWFVGGQFLKVDGLAATNLIHVTSDQKWDRTWDASVVGAGVYALAVDGDRLFIGGQIQRVKGVVRRGLAAVSVATADLLDWPASVNGSVYAVALSGGDLYVGGQFSSLGEASRENVGVVSAGTGLVGAWNPAADRAVLCLQIVDGYAYLGGQFTTVGGKPRNRLAAVAVDTGVASNWNPNPNGQVRCLVVSGTRVLAGGDFTSIGVKSRRGFAAVDRTTGAALDLDIGIEGSGTPQNLVWTIREHDGKAYVGGSFSRVQGKAQPMLAGVDLASGNATAVPLATKFNGARDDAWVGALRVSAGRWVVGGSFASMGGVERANAAAFALKTGAILPWNPSPDHSVLTLAKAGDAVYLGGTFTNCGGAESQGVAKVDAQLGQIDPAWGFGITNRSATYVVRTLRLMEDRILVGGLFEAIGGETRRWVAAVNRESGTPLPFQANVKGGSVGLQAVAVHGDVLVLAGDFTSVGNQARTRLAAVRLDTGEVLAWNPAPNREVSALAVAGDRLYVGGQFTRIAGIDLRLLAAFSMPSLELVPWDAAVSTSSSGVQALAVAETVVYAGGVFDAIGGEFRSQLAALNPETGQAMEWDPAPDNAPTVIAISEDWVGWGGAFRSVATRTGRSIAAYHALVHRGSNLTATNSGAGKLALTATTGDRTRAILQVSTNLSGWHAIGTNVMPGYLWNLEVPVTNRAASFYRVLAE